MNRLLNSFCILIIVFICSFPTLDAQVLTHRQGVYLIQIAENTNIEALSNKINRDAKITLKAVAPAFHIYEAAFDFTKIKASTVRENLQKIPQIKYITQDKFLDARIQPNDPRFGDQWYMGIPSAFGINMEAAWDIASSATTTENDTIVVAIVDDDFKLQHPDLKNNFWRNHNEIPDNNIDDDGNGYTDDYLGWDVSNRNDVLGETGKTHGTEVTGIVGALPNNAIGIAGIGWNIKIMAVSNSSETTAGVYGGYNYIFEMRKLYNETNGAKGAYVVCSNSSFGVELAFPDEFPIWCSLYDSLGSVGVLNVSATVNSLRDVGIRGDIPSLCSSDYLIVTSASDQAGNPYASGFSKTHVDIHAPGKDILTTGVNDNYLSFEGASLSSPMVAGVAGLLYASDCSNLVQLSKVSPSTAALYAKDFILNHAKPNPALRDYSVTGSILDAAASLQATQDSCQPCFAPVDIDYSFGVDSLHISWKQLPLVDSVRLRLTNLETDEIQTVSANNSIHVAVEDCTNYQMSLEALCITGSSRVILDTLLSEGCCKTPDQFRSIFTAEGQVNLTWQSVAVASKYDIRYRPVYTLEWDTVFNVQGNSRTIFGLAPCTMYEFEIKTYCTLDTIDFSGRVVAATLGCGSCAELDYCASASTSIGEFISRVTIGNRSFSSENSLYSLTEDSGIRFDACAETPFSVVFDNPTGNFSESVSIWVDFNQNGVFDDNEKLVSSEATFDSVSGTLPISQEIVNGNTRMRISLKFIGNNVEAPATPCETINQGEVEDYCVTLAGGGDPTCTGLSMDVQLVQDEKALFMHVPDDLKYTNMVALYRKAGSSDDWEAFPLHGRSPFHLPYELYDRCLSYEFKLEAQCGCQEALLSSEIDTEITPCNVSNQHVETKQVKLFPNPNNGQFQIKGLSLQDATVRVFDLNGKLVWIQENTTVQDGFTVEMGQTNKKGLYILNITNNFSNFNRKFILN